MSPVHDELCYAIIVDGAERTEGAVEPETLHRLAELGLAQWSDGEWQLTPAGSNLLPRLIDGEEVESLI